MSKVEEVVITRGALKGERGTILRKFSTFASIALRRCILTTSSDCYTPYLAGGTPPSEERAGAELQAERSEQP